MKAALLYETRAKMSLLKKLRSILDQWCYKHRAPNGAKDEPTARSTISDLQRISIRDE